MNTVFRTKLSNKVYLKEDFKSGLYYVKVFELLKLFITNHERIYGDFTEYYEDSIVICEFDPKLYKFLAGMGDSILKIKEIQHGIWMLRDHRGVCYFYEPKGVRAQAIRTRNEQSVYGRSGPRLY